MMLLTAWGDRAEIPGYPESCRSISYHIFNLVSAQQCDSAGQLEILSYINLSVELLVCRLRDEYALHDNDELYKGVIPPIDSIIHILIHS